MGYDTHRKTTIHNRPEIDVGWFYARIRENGEMKTPLGIIGESRYPLSNTRAGGCGVNSAEYA